MKRHLSSASTAAIGVLALVLAPKTALAQEAPESSAAIDANRGLSFGLGPVLLVPTEGGPLGGGLDVSGRYGFKAGPTILAPGGRLLGYILSSRFVGAAMPTFRVTVPAGPLAPFLMGGVGPGWISNPSDGGVAVLGGGGLMIHFGRVLALGAEATYQTITGTELKVIAIGPSILLGG